MVTIMSQLFKNDKIYYQEMEGTRYLLVDERSKKKLLDLLLEARRLRGWRTYAFCVTDESAYWITRARDGGQLQRDTEIAAWRFLQENEAAPAWKGQAPAWSRLWIEEIPSLSELPGRCRAIHRIPLELGYVRQIGDYWWSSYNSYAGVYRWETMDCQTVYAQFSPNREKARRSFIRYHKL